jgi:hypothetical protein
MFSKSSLQLVKIVRTIRQHNSEDIMAHLLNLIHPNLSHTKTPSVIEDAAGVAVLFVLLFVGLTLSGTA